MKITVTFDSMDEMLRFVDVRGQIQTTFTDFTPAEISQIEAQREAAPVKDPEPAPAPEPTPEPDPEPVKVTEDFRAEVRRAMATLNKQTGENTAKKILQERGFASLKDAPLEALPELMETVRGMVK